MTKAADVTMSRIGEFMSAPPVTVQADATATHIAEVMKARKVSCVLVTGPEGLLGIVTTSDLVERVLAIQAGPETLASAIMTADPEAVDIEAPGHDALLKMARVRIGHLPVMQGGVLVGVVTRSDLLAGQAGSAGLMALEIGRAASIDAVAEVVHRLPALLQSMVNSNAHAEVVTRLITDIGDAATCRFLALAEKKLGPPPVPYLWLACGSQGRQEQTGVSDQDNCLILHDDVSPEDEAYFESLAEYVSVALDKCGYFFCPGDMMATNPRWRQPLAVWLEYFREWVRQPDTDAQMLASVMFDLRPIYGEFGLFSGLHQSTLKNARRNSIFIAHMVSGVVRSSPPLRLLGGLATIRTGEHKDRIDFKHAGVAPVVDLARLYALQGELLPVNTRARLIAARDASVISASGAHDLLDAYDLFCEIRLVHQAQQVKNGVAPDNFVAPDTLSELQRDHLRKAFGVVKTMQSAALQGRAVLT